MDEVFFTDLNEFSRRLDFVDCVGVDVSFMRVINSRSQ
mgnify:CR=1 FL=1